MIPFSHAIEDGHDHDLVDHVPRVDEAGEFGDVAADPRELEVDDLLDRQVEQPVRRDGVPAQRVPLDQAAAVDEPLRCGADPVGVGLPADGLEAAPVERQGREVEEVEEGRCRPFDDLETLALELAVCEVDQVEVGGAEMEPVPPLCDDDVLAGDRRAGLVEDGKRGVRRPIAADQVSIGHARPPRGSGGEP